MQDPTFGEKVEEVRKVIIWCMSNFSRGKPSPKFAVVKCTVATMVDHLLRTPVMNLAEDVLWALGYITDGDDEDIDFVMNFNGRAIVDKLIQICESEKKDLENPVTRILGNLVTSSDTITDMVLNANGLKWICQML